MTDIKSILKQYWGYDEFRSLQEDVIRSVLAGQDTLALMPTGGGKSITYQISALAGEGLCIVITPLIALMKDQVEQLVQKDIPAEAIYTGMTSVQIESVINKCLYNRVKLLYISPERLASELFRVRLKQMNVTLLAVDEAHCISQWGYDFRPSYLRIAEIRTWFPAAPLLALTATATPQVVTDIQQQLQFHKTNVLSKSFRRDNIAYVVREAADKQAAMCGILSRISGSAIVYVRKRATAEELAMLLERRGIKATYYHAGLSSILREKRQDEWKSGAVPVIVATNAFGMGIDKSDVRIVVHFDTPDSPEAYFQEAGRVGRDGLKAYAVLLTASDPGRMMRTRIESSFPEKKYIRKIYEALGNYFQLEEGEGQGRAFEFDADTFVKNFHLEEMRTRSAIGILQVAGYIELTTDINSRSRIQITVSREALYTINAGSSLAERVLELLMRTCEGIFTKYTYFSEQYFADTLGSTRKAVYDTLIALARRKILSYVPGNDRPYIVYHQPRLPLSYVNIGRNAYEERKQNYAVKIHKMLEYLELKDGCRQLFLMEYFGQKDTRACGICDTCLNRKKGELTVDIDQQIIHRLKQSDTSLAELRQLIFQYNEPGTARLRFLIDAGIVYYKDENTLSLKDSIADSDPLL